MVNAGEYTIHGSYGIQLDLVISCTCLLPHELAELQRQYLKAIRVFAIRNIERLQGELEAPTLLKQDFHRRSRGWYQVQPQTQSRDEISVFVGLTVPLK